MGSSPVTATIHTLVDRFLDSGDPPVRPPIAIAFSGGPDSLGLLLALRRRYAAPELLAIHVDHGDGDSASRARAAADLARALDVPFALAEARVADSRRAGASWEATARQVRYRALFEIADHHGVFWIATAHHLQDQAETLLLRLRQGTDWMGLAGIAPRDGRLVRPVLEASREGLRALVDAGGLAPVEDPTNADLARARNFVRHRVLPRLAIAEGRSSRDLAAALSSLARAAVAARDRLAARDLCRPATSSAALDRWLAWQSARRSGVPFPGRAALDAARRKASPTFSGRGGALWRSEPPLPIVPPARTEAHPFSYTFRAPGRVEIVEIGRVLSIEQGREQDWMFGGRSEATGFCLLAGDDPLFLVRSRLPGDRFRPLGSAGSRKLKDVLIDRRVARAERDRIPLLVHAGNIVWVPGVTLAEEHRVRRGDPCWVATLEPLDRRTEVF